jgi:D-threo-aldose 1-dehydrogenase
VTDGAEARPVPSLGGPVLSPGQPVPSPDRPVLSPGQTVLSLGTAALGDLPGEPGRQEAVATVVAAVRDGVRFVDTSPWYGGGAAEERLGEALSSVPAGSVAVSTKVGYVVSPQARRGTQDFSADATLRSLEASLRRLGVTSVDTVLIHDPDRHERAARDGAYRALHRLRDEGVVRAIGVGMNQTAVLTRFVRETDVDVVLVAGRYTLLDQRAAAELLPECLRRGVQVVIGGVFNSGILADPKPGAHYDYAPADESTLARARALQRICASHGVPLAAAALRFPGRHPAVTRVLMGPGNRGELAANTRHWQLDIPDALWEELAACT